MKKRYTEEQIIKAIKQHEAGSKVEDLCREMGISCRHLLQLAKQICWLGSERSQAAEGA